MLRTKDADRIRALQSIVSQKRDQGRQTVGGERRGNGAPGVTEWERRRIQTCYAQYRSKLFIILRKIIDAINIKIYYMFKEIKMNRLYFMDNLRSFAICLVIIFHLTLLYTEFTPVQNPIPEAYNGIFMGISSLINGPLLNSIMFFIAGFFAFATYRRKGGLSFVKDKLIKLGIPYIGGLIVLAPVTQYIANHSWGKDDNFFQFLLKDFFLPKTITPHHLWFIGILLIFFVIAIPFFNVLQKNKKEIRHKRYVQNIIIVFFLAGMFFAYFGLGFFCKPYDFISIYIINFPPMVLPIYAAYFILGVYAYFQNWFSIEHKQYIFPWAIAYIIFLILNIGTFIVIPTALADNHPLLAIAFIGSTFT
jgi:hypothetical protein